MRLIDADKFANVINDWMSNIKCADDDDVANTEGQTLYYVLQLLGDMPTAYDVDKVVERLREKGQVHICGDGYDADAILERIIEIVKPTERRKQCTK